ncbi:SNARE [Hexamita inflata]|uniref:SNARE n=1 Tax=Hexamita inflata TaxID=28002 RepID=A0AA86NZM6_9EUKA|nr:SNARE [Hexamita inflata]
MAEEFKQNCDDIRSRVAAGIQKIQRVAQGRAQGQDSASLAGEIQSLEQDIKQLEKQYKSVMGDLGDEVKTYDDKMVHIRSKMTDLSKQYKNHMSKQYAQFEPNQVNPEEATVENMQIMKKQKDENLSLVHEQVKGLKRVNQDIKQELDKGDEVMDELKTNITDANSKVVAVKNTTQAFTLYLKRNKAPFGLTILVLIFTVCVWASKGFCTWGLKVNCPK